MPTLAGLPGPPTAFMSEAECFVDAGVLVRLRAVLARPAPWRSLGGQYGGTYAGVDGRPVEAELAVRDQRTGKPLGFRQDGRVGQDPTVVVIRLRVKRRSA